MYQQNKYLTFPGLGEGLFSYNANRSILPISQALCRTPFRYILRNSLPSTIKLQGWDEARTGALLGDMGTQ